MQEASAMSAHRRGEEKKEELPQLSQSQSLTNHVSTATWRKRGEQLRASVIEQDESNGVHAFILSSSCPIHRYYQVADKVRMKSLVVIF
jgi:carotenoid cleavage dioxygenase-like enzyme